MRGGWTIAASPVRPPYVFARGVSPLWLARVRRLLTENANGDGPSASGPSLEVRAWSRVEEWNLETRDVRATLRAEAEGV
jgi:hypothetical protein